MNALLTIDDLVVEYPGRTTVRAVDGIGLSTLR